MIANGIDLTFKFEWIYNNRSNENITTFNNETSNIPLGLN